MLIIRPKDDCRGFYHGNFRVFVSCSGNDGNENNHRSFGTIDQFNLKQDHMVEPQIGICWSDWWLNLSPRRTPSHHPFLDGILPYELYTIHFGCPHNFWKPSYNLIRINTINHQWIPKLRHLRKLVVVAILQVTFLAVHQSVNFF